MKEGGQDKGAHAKHSQSNSQAFPHISASRPLGEKGPILTDHTVTFTTAKVIKAFSLA